MGDAVYDLLLYVTMGLILLTFLTIGVLPILAVRYKTTPDSLRSIGQSAEDGS